MGAFWIAIQLWSISMTSDHKAAFASSSSSTCILRCKKSQEKGKKKLGKLKLLEVWGCSWRRFGLHGIDLSSHLEEARKEHASVRPSSQASYFVLSHGFVWERATEITERTGTFIIVLFVETCLHSRDDVFMVTLFTRWGSGGLVWERSSGYWIARLGVSQVIGKNCDRTNVDDLCQLRATIYRALILVDLCDFHVWKFLVEW